MSLHVKLQLPSLIFVDVMTVGVIDRVGLMLPPYEAWCSAPTHHVGHCGLSGLCNFYSLVWCLDSLLFLLFECVFLCGSFIVC